ncbi:MAG: two-component regulator propeller domain-containing protein [Chryseolinea sp.]
MKMNLNFAFGLALLLIISITGTSQIQNLEFDQLSVEQGLSQGNVWDIYQDHLGFIWIATEDGLNVYDGYSFTIFRNNPADSFSISNGNIRCIAEGSNGDLWVATRGGLNLYHRDSGRFERFMSNGESKGAISSNLVEFLYFDSEGHLWAATENGLNLYNAEKKSFKHFFHEADNPKSLVHSSVRTILEDDQNRMWIGTVKGLSLLNNDRATFTNFSHDLNVPASLSTDRISSLYEDKDQVLWVGTFNSGLYKKLPGRNKFTSYTHDPHDQKSLSSNSIYGITQDKAGVLWIASEMGINKVEKKEGTFSVYSHNEDNPNSLRANSATKILFDVNDRMWIGTRFGGVNIYDKNKYGFVHYQHKSYDKNSLGHNTISSFKEDKNGNFWVATDGGGLNYFDRKSSKFTSYLNTFTNNKILALEKDGKGGLWVGMWDGGLTHFDPATKEVKHYRHDPKNTKSLSDNNVFYILKDSKGTIWVATWGSGLNRYNTETDDFTRFSHNPDDPNSIGGASVDYLFEDSNGKIWIGTELSGIDMFDPKANTFVHYKASAKTGSLTNSFILTIFEDSKKRIWVGTYGGGLNLFEPKTKTFKAFRMQDGLPNDAIMSMQEDANHQLWISTGKGLSRFDPENISFKNFVKSDGLQGNQFTRWASARLSTGELLFGGTNGFTLFHPDNIKENTYKPPVYITDFRIYNKSVSVGEKEILKKNIILTKEIHLNYLENIFTLEFSALNYLQSEKNQYRYKMDGFQEEWIDAGTERKASYTNLDPGEYTFRVMAANNDGLWNEKEASLRIIIQPPYWGTWWFKTLGIFLIIGLGIVFVWNRIDSIKRQKLELEEQVRLQTAEVIDQKETLEVQAESMQMLNDRLLEQTDFLQTLNNELQQQKEEIIIKREEAEKARIEAEKANQAKSTFLATMSHEIRTPMNGVLGMASLLAETSLTTEQKEYTDTIRGSGEALLTVINDILDFSKIESGNLALDNHAFDLRQCIEDVMDIFSMETSQKGLDLVYEIDHQIPAEIISDSHRLRQILLNLIGNAMKFTEEGEIFIGIYLLKTEKDQLELAFQVRDTGIGIPADKLSRLFKAFSQVDSSTTRKYGGTGLGLVIAQRLVELMGGSIAVESQPGVGTSFSFTIKVLINQLPIRQYVNARLTGEEGKKVLVVDDNATNLTILRGQLEQWGFLPALASTGAQALQLLREGEKYDLVITDMQMPDMDGVQLTLQIKKSHGTLPVILLSSIGDESKRKHPGLFSAVLNKPVKQQQFREVLHSVLRPQDEMNPQEEQKSTQVLSADFAKKHPLKILIAEDNPINHKMIIRVLNKLGYQQIEIAHNGFEAVEKFNEQFYDVILMDVQMPEMDGMEATRMIRTKQYHQPVIIAMTANAMQGDREQCLKAGMDDYVSKPVKLETLVSVLEKWSITIKNITSIYPEDLSI